VTTIATGPSCANLHEPATKRLADRVHLSLLAVQDWIERCDYKGYEPFDGLSSWARPFALGNEFGERLLLQLIRQCPLNLRPLFGVRPQDSTKGRGYMAAGYLAMYRVTGESRYLNQAKRCLEWLGQHKAPKFDTHSWSNHFDFVSRGGSYTKDDPIIVWTSLIGHAYVEAFIITGDEWYLSIADSACKWIMALPREQTSSGNCISYLAHVQSSIHNANMLGASLLACTARHTGTAEYQEVARSAMQYSCSRQLADGAWWYAELPKYHWVDNFHTGYNLDSLDLYVEATEDEEWKPALQKGLDFYLNTFFEPTGRPKYYDNRTFPVDIQCIAQSIDTLSRFALRDPRCLDMAVRVAHWAIRNMQDDRSGHFFYRQYPLLKSKTPMLHWGQATMFKALAVLYGRLAADFGEGVQHESSVFPAGRSRH